ncbi:tyrosine-type recombinase/integrase [Pantoea sp. LMR881]|uniref:tyrosine-type recombinase/integrase n=1 Tax=Pantoea sp. LMR881 TaxID=3014336 RepID=UPI0022B02C79|nr:tyrosine-type recombinase/integrase [Pantoea sp. LMR881]MCZ4061181.1 tyrosine-type recombinase/integrase [Pantoea sp. LMR881]MCZ4061292.1 tyrosine-type recombinase/integrase [Pantoea sp. LMR881]
MGGISKRGNVLTTFNNSEDLALRLRNFIKDKDAYSENTWKQLLSVMRVCNRWAMEYGRSFLPMSSEDLRAYLIYLQESGRASSTIKQHAAMISLLHRNAGYVAPNTSPDVTRAIKKINRTAVMSGERTGQALPFRKTDLMKFDELWGSSPRLQDLRDLAFLHVSYSTLMRISEISRIRVKDLSRAEDGRFIIDVRYTKTIVNASGVIKALSARSSKRLTEWLEAAALFDKPEAYIFCRVHRTNKPLTSDAHKFSTRSMEEIFVRAWQLSGNDETVKTNKNRYAGWSGHSARVGAAQDMTNKGFSVAEIMQEGTWRKTETLMGYIRHVEAHKGAMIKHMEDED